MKVIVAHPGQQHSFKVASALKKEGYLLNYMTAVYDKKDNLAMNLAHLLVRGHDISKIAGRKNKDLVDEDVVTYYTFLSLGVIVLSRFAKTKNISYWLDRKIADLFGKKVAKYAIKHDADVVICFSMNETVCFEYLKKHAPQILRIVDCANSPVDYMRYIYEQDVGFSRLKKEAPTFWNEKELKKQKRGINSTQYFFAPSEFVKKGLAYCGADENSVKIVPYGTNFAVNDKPQGVPEDVRFIYVGQVTYRKGMHYLLKAFAELEEGNIHLDVVGAWKTNSDLYEEYSGCSNITFHGNVPHEKVRDLLCSANVFVFSSLTEGLSLSCLEAFSCGLPVICSTNAGANDLIVDGKNGFVVAPNDIIQLKKYIMYFVNNKTFIPTFSREALKTAQGCTWENYQKTLVSVLKHLNH